MGFCYQCADHIPGIKPEISLRCRECREKENRKLARQMEEALPLFRVIVEAVRVVVKRAG